MPGALGLSPADWWCRTWGGRVRGKGKIGAASRLLESHSDSETMGRYETVGGGRGGKKAG